MQSQCLVHIARAAFNLCLFNVFTHFSFATIESNDFPNWVAFGIFTSSEASALHPLYAFFGLIQSSGWAKAKLIAEQILSSPKIWENVGDFSPPHPISRSQVSRSPHHSLPRCGRSIRIKCRIISPKKNANANSAAMNVCWPDSITMCDHRRPATKLISLHLLNLSGWTEAYVEQTLRKKS